MTEFNAITLEDYASKAWRTTTNYSFAGNENVIPLAGSEIAKTAITMPTGFIRQGNEYKLIAITSLQPNTNLYVAPNGKWLGSYIPAAIRAYPFKMLKDTNSENSVLCIANASGLVYDSKDDGHAFFDESGAPSQETKEVLKFLSDIEANYIATQKSVNLLVEHSLLKPWELSLIQGENKVQVNGLFNIDEVELNNLSDEKFLALRKESSLAIAYAQLLSMNQLSILENLDQLQGQLQEQVQPFKKSADGVNEFSLSEDSGSIRF
jgi:hypothetical protein